jgi:hypothetical protein
MNYLPKDIELALRHFYDLTWLRAFLWGRIKKVIFQIVTGFIWPV